MQTEPNPTSTIKNCALNLLSRREHSQSELRNKLRLRNFDNYLIEDVLQSLASEGLQSDARFVESYVRMRSNRGYGPLRITVELFDRGINDDLISQYLDDKDHRWAENIIAVYRKKFGSKPPKDFAERAKRMRFLQYRGFTGEQIKYMNVQTLTRLDNKP